MAQQIKKLDIPDSEGLTPFHFAAKTGNTGLIRKLIAFDADVNVTAADGATPLIASTFSGNPVLAAALLDAGAELNAVDNSGTNSTMQAIRSGETTMAAFLIAKGGIVDFLDPAVKALDGNRLEADFRKYEALGNRERANIQAVRHKWPKP